MSSAVEAPPGGTTDLVTLQEAATLLGITVEGVRKRIVRGQLTAAKQADGKWMIARSRLAPPPAPSAAQSAQPPSDTQTDKADGSERRLVEQLEAEVTRLWEELTRRNAEVEAQRRQLLELLRDEQATHADELERRAEEMRRKDIMLAEFARANAELKAQLALMPPTPPPTAPTTAPTGGPPTPPKPSWWRRLLYGPGADPVGN